MTPVESSESDTALGRSNFHVESVFEFRAPLEGGIFYAGSEASYAEISVAISDIRRQVDSLLGMDHPEFYQLFLVDNEALFDSLVGSGFPDWGGAVAIPRLNRIVLRTSNLNRGDKSLRALTIHEYAHLVTHVASVSAGNAPPRWLDEGLAMYLAGEWSYQDLMSVALASFKGNFIPFDRIDQLNSFDKSEARLAYAQSYLAVRYLIEYYGTESLRAILARLKSGESIDDALLHTIGTDVEGFQAEALDDIKRKYSLGGIVLNSNLFWGALALLVIVGFIMVRKRRQKYYESWEKQEELESTDFDYGDPDHPEKIEDEDEPWKE